MFDFFRPFNNNSNTSKNVAKERLKLVLVHDRIDCSPQLLEAIKDDILKVTICDFAGSENNKGYI